MLSTKPGAGQTSKDMPKLPKRSRDFSQAAKLVIGIVTGRKVFRGERRFLAGVPVLNEPYWITGFGVMTGELGSVDVSAGGAGCFIHA